LKIDVLANKFNATNSDLKDDMKYLVIYASIFFSSLLSPIVFAEEKGFFSTVFDDVTSSGFSGAYERKKIREWYQINKGKLVIVKGSEKIWCEKESVRSVKDCTFSAQLVNHTDYELTGLVLKIKVYNKNNSSLVAEEIFTLNISIYPTVKKSINVKFFTSHIGKARSQLGKNFSWNYELAAYLPDHLHKKDIMDHRSGSTRGYDWLAE
jgi:hypothetical protein